MRRGTRLVVVVLSLLELGLTVLVLLNLFKRRVIHPHLVLMRLGNHLPHSILPLYCLLGPDLRTYFSHFVIKLLLLF